MKNLKKITLGIIGAVLLAASLWACSNDNDATTAENSKRELFAKDAEKIPLEERERIYDYFIQYYQITDIMQSLLNEEKLILGSGFNEKLKLIKTQDQLKDLLYEYKFSNPDDYIMEFEKIHTLQQKLREENEVFSGLDISLKESIVAEILEASFQDYYTTIINSRTCAEQFNIDIRRAKRDYAVCGGFAIVAAATTGLVGGLPAAGYCMTTYYLDLSDAKSDYNDCIKK